MSDAPAHRSALDRLLDAGVFAPLGFLLTRDQTLTDLATAGRKQIAFSRSLRHAAIKGIAKGAQPQRSTARRPDSAATPVAPVEGYDSMTARDIIAVLSDCTDERAAWIRERESAGKNRVTVLRAVEAR